MRKEKTARAREAEKDKQSAPSLPHSGIGRPDVKDSLRRLSSAGRLGLRKLWLCALRRHRLVRAVFPENDEEDVAHLAGYGANSSQMMFAPVLQRLVVFRQNRVAERGAGCGQPDSPAQIRGSPLGNVVFGSCELT